jgi:hypothetical protein
MYPSVTPAERLAGLQHVAGADCDRHSLQTAFAEMALTSNQASLRLAICRHVFCVYPQRTPRRVFGLQLLYLQTSAWGRQGHGLGEIIVISTTIAVPSTILTISLPITPAQRLADVQSTMAEGADCPMRCSKVKFCGRGAERGKHSQQVITESSEYGGM